MKLISYCIPVMNRTADIKKTLYSNMSVIRKFSENAELIINCFDADDDLFLWINKKFNSDIKSGLLQLNKLKPLMHWHFCWAKNSFKPYISSKYYASLDGDNYLTEREVAATINICKATVKKILVSSFQWYLG